MATLNGYRDIEWKGKTYRWPVFKLTDQDLVFCFKEGPARMVDSQRMGNRQRHYSGDDLERKYIKGVCAELVVHQAIGLTLTTQVGKPAPTDLMNLVDVKTTTFNGLERMYLSMNEAQLKSQAARLTLVQMSEDLKAGAIIGGIQKSRYRELCHEDTHRKLKKEVMVLEWWLLETSGVREVWHLRGLMEEKWIKEAQKEGTKHGVGIGS